MTMATISESGVLQWVCNATHKDPDVVRRGIACAEDGMGWDGMRWLLVQIEWGLSDWDSNDELIMM